MIARRPALAVFVIALGTSAAFTGAQAPTSSLTGTAKLAGGGVEGVVVSARAAGSNITTSVLTDGRGEYVFPPLDGGPYDVWAQATGYQTARASLAIEGGRQAHQAFTLNAIDDITPQLSASEWFSVMPEETKEQRRMKAIFRTNCTACHGPTHALQNRFDENGWRAEVMFMERMTGTGGINRHTTVAHYRDELARYLASLRGPASPPLKFTASRTASSGDMLGVRTRAPPVPSSSGMLFTTPTAVAGPMLNPSACSITWPPAAISSTGRCTASIASSTGVPVLSGS